MSQSTIRKLILFNLLLLVGNVGVFSNAFLKIQLFGSSLQETLIGGGVILVSAVLFFVVNMRLINGQAPKINPAKTVEKITDLDSCDETIARLGYDGLFAEQLRTVLDQIDKIKKKRELIRENLLLKFTEQELSYSKFTGIVDQAEKVMVVNIRSMLSRIAAFDEEEYNQIKRGKSTLRQSIATQKMDIYNGYIDFVSRSVDGNEEILLRLDRLLFEIANLNSLDVGELEKMEAIRELDTLIRDSKWYK